MSFCNKIIEVLLCYSHPTKILFIWPLFSTSSLSQPQMLCYTSSDVGKKVTGTWKIFVRNCRATKFLELHTTDFWKITCLSLQKHETTINVFAYCSYMCHCFSHHTFCVEKLTVRLTNILLLYHFSWATWDNVMIGVLKVVNNLLLVLPPNLFILPDVAIPILAELCCGWFCEWHCF